MAINELRAIATFAKAVELGSIRRAAAFQGVTPQAASQSIAQLEAHLGVRLLHRTTRSLALTDEGQHFLETTQPALATLDRALTQARESKDEIAGPLRIVGPRSSFSAILMPVLDEFCTQYPGIQPDVQLDDGKSNWVLERVDVGFRIGASPDEGVIARRLFPVQLIICAAPAYLERHGAPKTLDDLVRHRCSAFRHPSTCTTAACRATAAGARLPRTRHRTPVESAGARAHHQGIVTGRQPWAREPARSVSRGPAHGRRLSVTGARLGRGVSPPAAPFCSKRSRCCRRAAQRRVR